MYDILKRKNVTDWFTRCTAKNKDIVLKSDIHGSRKQLHDVYYGFGDNFKILGLISIYLF